MWVEGDKRVFTVGGVTRWQRNIRSLAAVPDRRWRNYLIDNGYWPPEIAYNREDNTLIHPALGMPIGWDRAWLFHGEHTELLKLMQKLGATWSIQRDQLQVSYCGVNLLVTNPQELEFIYEIHALEEYGISGLGNVVVWDIGANVGFTSLYFAAQDFVKAVAAYEPFPKTVAKAIDNFDLNPAISSKIAIYNAAIGEASGKGTWEYSPLYAGSTGADGLPDFLRATAKIERVDIRIESAVAVLNEIRSKYATFPLLIKIDAEGAEYGIIASLAEFGLLDQHVAAIVIETHQGRGREILPFLENAGFVSVFHGLGAPLGLIYGVNKRR
jgi:FkbM family methyltransferase